jgi:RNA polymerase sigma-70 factor (sigma-E family)
MARSSPTEATDTHEHTRLTVKQVALLVEESSLGTVGARQLRDRTPSDTTALIKARAYITADDPQWWPAHHNDAHALFAKALELAPKNPQISEALLRRAAGLGHREARHILGVDVDPTAKPALAKSTSDAKRKPGQDTGWRAFADFYREHFGPLTRALYNATVLTYGEAQTAIRQVMTQAFDEWGKLAEVESPEEVVLGRALQRHRRTLSRRSSEPVSAGGELVVAPAGAAVRMTGALTAAVDLLTVRVATVDWDADQAVTALYSAHYRSLVRLATLLVRDVATAEEVVQDAFVAMHGAWRRLRDPNKALSYLRQSVVNRSRSVLRHRAVLEKYAPEGLPDEPSAENGAIAELERSAVVKALNTLPARQREALVLRYYGDLSEADIASTMGISRGAVKSHTARGMAALRSVLEQL